MKDCIERGNIDFKRGKCGFDYEAGQRAIDRAHTPIVGRAELYPAVAGLVGLPHARG